uniref:Uncharacterized protein n=1 Tax=Rhizophora mucronata TaxID=61149 RepID=A0A2P2Q211_RHIMU
MRLLYYDLDVIGFVCRIASVK